MRSPTSTLRTSVLPLCLFALAGCATEELPTCEGEDCIPAFESIRLTYLDVQYDLTQPVYLNNRVPVEYGLTATSEDGVATQTAVSFSFVEANPEDANAPIECSSSAAVVELPGDGEEHRFFGYIWPTTACEELLGREVNVRVEFDASEELETPTDSPAVSYTAALREEAINQLCVNADGEAGCVYDIDLQPTPSDASGDLIDVRHAGMSTSSAVASLPIEEGAASLAIESTLVVNGRDPYIAAVDPATIPADLAAEEPDIVEDLQFGESTPGALIAMPGPARLVYTLRPVGSDDAYLPLRVGAEESEETLDAAPVNELLPGTPNALAHELFAEGATYAALQAGGAWADETDFEVRGCFEAEFTQLGNEGATFESNDDCRTVEIVLVRETESTAAATAHEFNRSFNRSMGNSRLRLEAGLETENRLDSSGASSRVEGNVSIRGRLGRSFGIDIVRALARASAGLDPADNGYEILLRAFNQTIFEASDSGDTSLTREEDVSFARSHRFPTLGYGFGPARIGITITLGGEAGINVADVLETSVDRDRCTELLGQSFEACGAMSRTTTPYFAFTANVEGGVRAGPFSAGVEARMRIINTELPLQTTLGLGRDSGGAISVLGNAQLNLELRLIQGNVSLVGRIRFRRRFLRRFNRTMRVTLFRFQSPLISRNLLDQTLALEVLQ